MPTMRGLPSMHCRSRYKSTMESSRSSHAPSLQLRPAPATPSSDGRGHSDAAAWLQERGVRPHNAATFLRRSGCRTIADLAIFLRFQLPPPEYASSECIHTEMHELLGVPPSAAQRIISGLGIMRAPLPSESLIVVYMDLRMPPAPRSPSLLES